MESCQCLQLEEPKSKRFDNCTKNYWLETIYKIIYTFFVSTIITSLVITYHFKYQATKIYYLRDCFLSINLTKLNLVKSNSEYTHAAEMVQKTNATNLLGLTSNLKLQDWRQTFMMPHSYYQSLCSSTLQYSLLILLS